MAGWWEEDVDREKVQGLLAELDPRNRDAILSLCEELTAALRNDHCVRHTCEKIVGLRSAVRNNGDVKTAIAAVNLAWRTAIREKAKTMALKNLEEIAPEEDARITADALADPDNPPADDLIRRNGRTGRA